MNLSQALRFATSALSPSATARLDAEILLTQVLHVSRAYLLAHDERLLSLEEEDRYRRYILQRQENEPLAYLTGHKEFWSLDLQVNTATLIPRPETELLVELLLDFFDDKNSACRVADLGTGSGAIALALASERPHWELYATDQSASALKQASFNARKLAIENVRFCQGSWCKALPSLLFDALVSNPPYLSEAEWELAPQELFFEPFSALVGGNDGLKDLRELILTAKNYLVPGGYLLLEHGHTQAVAVRELFEREAYVEVSSYSDLAGIERATKGRLP